jgi:murein DD-endopeptidase MepM/ murein hydrolase activator NlpD
MSSKIEKYLGFLAVFSVLVANTALGFAQTSNDLDFEDGDIEVLDTETEEAEDEDNYLVDQDEFLKRLKGELNLSKADYRQVLNSISDTNAKLKAVSEEKTTLAEQLKNIDLMANNTTNKLFDVLKQIIEKENRIILIQEDIEIKEIAIKYQKSLLSDYIKIIYQEENNYLSFSESGEISAFKLLLADGSVGENLKEIEYFNMLNVAGQQMADELAVLSNELLKDQKRLNKEKTELISLHSELENEKQQLDIQKQSKESLLALTNGQEEIFTQLLEQTKAEQETLINDIKNLSNAIDFISLKMEEEGADFNPDNYMSLLDYKTQALYSFHLNNFDLNSNGFVWPVDPDRGISAYFRDPSYVNVFGVQHNAVDLPAYQGSAVRAVADGVVYSARDNGYGYSYIILAHADGFMTVYGHMSNILIAEGDTISQGAIIGLSGGMPGTIGAGYMTTGPHLHFEVLLNGLYVDPLTYLPLEVLTEEQIELLPEKYYDDWEASVYDSNFEAIERF